MKTISISLPYLLLLLFLNPSLSKREKPNQQNVGKPYNLLTPKDLPANEFEKSMSGVLDMYGPFDGEQILGNRICKLEINS
jgi:hypothetical protein